MHVHGHCFLRVVRQVLRLPADEHGIENYDQAARPFAVAARHDGFQPRALCQPGRRGVDAEPLEAPAVPFPVAHSDGDPVLRGAANAAWGRLHV
eukprot:14060446-Alexandrium_andersonii.AAC.1